MRIFTTLPPLSLYIHLPWCVQKCPYCDFNSHAAPKVLPEQAYLSALERDLDDYLPLLANRPLHSIFFGGGTPSLFSAHAIEKILDRVAARLSCSPHIEITLEANPGTIEQDKFKGFYQAGVNRLSLGVQSFQNEKLKSLGRIHDATQAQRAIEIAQQAGFDRFNIDLMYGLPDQSIADALFDLKTALRFAPTHLSWYQLTIEPNTFFHFQPPLLPNDDLIWEMQLAGQTMLAAAGLNQYEVSAYAKPTAECLHNRNYWEFGDYLGIGAGAHSKLTQADGHIARFSQIKHPRIYLSQPPTSAFQSIKEQDAIFEFMLNALRLTQGVSYRLFTERTGLDLSHIQDRLITAQARDLLIMTESGFYPSAKGLRFLNDLMMMFLPAESILKNGLKKQ